MHWALKSVHQCAFSFVYCINIAIVRNFMFPCVWFQMGSQYQRSVPLEVRRAEGERVRAKHPDKIPIIVERSPRSRAPELDKKKYLVPSDLTVGQLCFLIRQRVSLRPEEALFFFVNNSLPPSSSPLSAVYEVNISVHARTDSQQQLSTFRDCFPFPKQKMQKTLHCGIVLSSPSFLYIFLGKWKIGAEMY
uniref:Zgc:92606 n=1 Tax=Astatotilapia calliptera TaxID=8154 RepID=A0AAX7UIB6_ASTCA